VPVLIIGTTNRVDLIDDALLRPSRFRPLKIGLPELDARRQIAEYHSGHFEVKVSEELLDMIAMASDQFSGDDIRSLFRDARAGELVGERRPADAFRLGQLVGQLKRSRQQRQADRTELRPAGTAQAGQRARLRDTPTGAVPHRSRPAEAGSGSPGREDPGSPGGGDGADQEGTPGS
jgi:transitional endoplasmic reticulum ATPase